MKPALLSRIAALETVAAPTDGVGVILLRIVNPDSTPAPVTRYSGDGLEWTLQPGETAADFEVRVVAEADAAAKANNRVMLLAPRLDEN